MRNNDVIVVGAGVMGLTTAVVLAERGVRVRVWTRDPVEATTSAVAGALWWPYRIEPVTRARAWALQSLDVYEELATRPESTGVRMVEGVLGEADLDRAEAWAAARVRGLRASTAEEYTGRGLWARLPLIDMSTHLPWLRERLVKAGGVIEERTVAEFAEADAPVVVNCTGLGARELVPDASVLPDQSEHIVLTVGADNVVTPKRVQVGDLRDGLRLIRAGLTPSDQVIIGGLPAARPGSKVSPETGAIHFAADQSRN